MQRHNWLQILAFSLLFTLLFGTTILLMYRWVTLPAREEGRRNLYLLVANMLESAPYPQAIERIEQYRAESPSLASHIWVISDRGHVLATNTSLPLPAGWRDIPPPQQPHALAVKNTHLRLFPRMTLVRLRDPQPTFALIQPSGNRPTKTMVYAQLAIFAAALLGMALGGLAITFFYLRKTSREARQVMARLFSGDLQARFAIHRVDKIGAMKLDFNTMADEIQKLLIRLRETDNARKTLLHELGHDLRTPLTSLRTVTETLSTCSEQMSVAEMREFVGVIRSELDYFVRLVDDLFLIADIAEPGYHGSNDIVDLKALIVTEVQKQRIARPRLTWHVNDTVATAPLCGDSHLLSRLLRNTLDNAGKYARSHIDITIQRDDRGIEFCVADDGPGISDEALASFGKRRTQRVRCEQPGDLLDVSLGLGSVIVKTVVELHRGRMRINRGTGEPPHSNGTCFRFWFPAVVDEDGGSVEDQPPDGASVGSQ